MSMPVFPGTVCSVTIPRWCLEQVCWVHWLLQKKAHSRFIWLWRYSLLGPNSTYKSSLCGCDHGLCGLCCVGSLVPRYPLEDGSNQQPVGSLAVHWVSLASTRRNFQRSSGSVREIALICSGIVRICFHHVPAGQLQVSEIKKWNWCQQWLSYRQNWDSHLAACSSAVPKGCHSDFEVTESLLSGLTDPGLVRRKVFGE